jgi:anti-sigma factor RsiW
MNTHSEIRDLLGLAASGLLDSTEEKMVRAHLRECAECAAELAQWQIITQALGQQPAPPFSASLARATVAQVRQAHLAQSEVRTRNFFLSVAIGFGWLFSALTILLLSAVIRYFAVLHVGGSPLITAIVFSIAFTAVTAGITAVVLGTERRTVHVPLVR